MNSSTDSRLASDDNELSGDGDVNDEPNINGERYGDRIWNCWAVVSSKSTMYSRQRWRMIKWNVQKNLDNHEEQVMARQPLPFSKFKSEIDPDLLVWIFPS